MKELCSKCKTKGKYLGVYKDCTGPVIEKQFIWHCRRCGRVWTTKSKERTRKVVYQK